MKPPVFFTFLKLLKLHLVPLGRNLGVVGLKTSLTSRIFLFSVEHPRADFTGFRLGRRDLVGVYGRCGRSVRVAQFIGCGYKVNAIGNHGRCCGVPIGYNKDKSGNPVIAMGFGFVLILFPLKRPLKTGFEIGGDNRECYIKDKNIWEILEGILWHTILK